MSAGGHKFLLDDDKLTPCAYWKASCPLAPDPERAGMYDAADGMPLTPADQAGLAPPPRAESARRLCKSDVETSSRS
eukprot:CAMPEP_0202820560 /NCGR_PEP_ID=MMETSP1389-20130828/9830_1 /ASSEMBLY_ACC=CAM_ASM_000865 /TAXON_ID=302021 /ORGANISM="Rhodomonas sp., Strain CCMP768" /LENGTH=76 /DNA_ID=CAMNT_0049493253 /DNA_START=186 /DNA_END=416 /DNA_ORIENTATION=+